MIREIVKYGDEILRTDCEIALDNKETHKHIKDLKETLLNIENGAGLAAPQLGINSRIFVTRNYKDDKREEVLTFINPKIRKKSKECLLVSDGCLSIPNVFSKTKRHSFIEVSYFNENFEEVFEELEGFQSVVFQHELDHLSGILFIDLLEESEFKEFEKFLKEQKSNPNLLYIDGKIIKTVLT